MKKKNLLMTAIAILGLATLSMAQVPYYVPTNGLVGWWPFNGNANDQSGNGNNGTTTGTFANDRYNSPNSAIALSGSQQLITIPGANSFDTDTFTLSFWTLANNYNIHNKIQYGVIGNSLRFSMNWSLTGLSYYPMTCAGTYAASGNGTSLSGVNLNIWHHITYVVQGTTTSFYINGFLIDVQNSASPLTCFSSIMNLYFGGDIGGGIIEYYSGLFDDIGFWTIALTSQEIANLFNGCIASVNSQPTNQTININNNAQFVVNSSDPIAIYQWQTDLGVGFQNLNSVGQYTGTTNDTLTVSNVTMSNNNQAFRCIVSSGSCSDTSNVAVLAVCANSTTITPQNNSLTTGSTATFTATTSDPNPSFVWQSDFGQGFQTLNNFGNYSGVNTNTLTINNLQLAYHLQQIRAISTSGNCIDTSNIAVINILDTCLVTVYDTLLTTVTDTLVINTQITGINPPNNLNTLKVFPNPASTHITIDYGNFNAMSGYTLTIVNSIGQTVFTTPINQQTSYIDLSTWTGNGIYFVQLIDPQNNTIENRKIVIQ